MRRGRSGRRLLAVRTNERAAAALGISVPGAKVYAFALSAGIAAVGGMLLAFRKDVIIYGTEFTNFTSILVVAWAFIGGIGFLLGPIFGSTLAPGSIGGAASPTRSSASLDPLHPAHRRRHRRSCSCCRTRTASPRSRSTSSSGSVGKIAPSWSRGRTPAPPRRRSSCRPSSRERVAPTDAGGARPDRALRRCHRRRRRDRSPSARARSSG